MVVYVRNGETLVEFVDARALDGNGQEDVKNAETTEPKGLATLDTGKPMYCAFPSSWKF